MTDTTVPQPPRTGRPPGRPGVGAIDVERAADQLLRAGRRPTLAAVREVIGRGSPNTIQPLLDAWWSRLSARLEAGPAALARIPEAVLHIVEALWLQCLESARSRVSAEQGARASVLDAAEDRLEVRSHVLTLREGELDARLAEQRKTIDALRAHIRALKSLLSRQEAGHVRRASDRSSPPAKPRTKRKRAARRATTSRRKGHR
jgi:uncharacterized coiled-coil protein SlyX